MKKILITTGIFPPDIGGPASYGEKLANFLCEKGIEVCVLTYSRNFKIDNSKYRFKVIRVWGGWPIWVKHFIFGLKLLSIVPKYDTVYSLNIWSAGFPSLMVSKIFKKKFIVKIVGDYAWEVGVGKGKVSVLIDDFQRLSKKGWIGILYKLQKLICIRADTIIVPSEYLKKIVIGWGVSEDKVEVIYNGVDFDVSELTKEEARRKIGIFGHIILTSGRLVSWKGFRMMIKIMPRVFEINQAFRLVIVGDGPDRKNLESMVKNLGLERKVFLVGKKSKVDLATYMAAAEMFVLDTGYEGFSHQILEAMSASIPVITTAVGGNKEIVEQGENGFLVKYNDEFNLLEAIKTLWQNPDLREEFVSKGLKTVDKFSFDKMLKETIKTLTNV